MRESGFLPDRVGGRCVALGKYRCAQHEMTVSLAGKAGQGSSRKAAAAGGQSKRAQSNWRGIAGEKRERMKPTVRQSLQCRFAVTQRGAFVFACRRSRRTGEAGEEDVNDSFLFQCSHFLDRATSLAGLSRT